MWDGETTVKFLDKFLSNCFKVKRKSLGLRWKHKGMAVCDRAGVHLHRGFLEVRKLWAESQNVVLFGCDPDADHQVPARIGEAGSPNDAYHQFIHMIRRFRERT